MTASPAFCPHLRCLLTAALLAPLAAQDAVAGDELPSQLIVLPLPATLLGGLHMQYFWIEDLATLTLSASDALQIQ